MRIAIIPRSTLRNWRMLPGHEVGAERFNQIFTQRDGRSCRNFLGKDVTDEGGLILPLTQRGQG